MINIILDHLAKAEGTEVHYNKGEKDITAPYGIYKYRNKTATIFKHIDTAATLCGIFKQSRNFVQSDIDAINTILDDKDMRELAKEFYIDYFKGAHLDSYPEECVVAYADMFTNSPKMAMKSVQEALIKLDHNPIDNFNALSTVDGKYGTKTREALLILKYGKQGLLLKSFMISAMKSNYVKLATGNPTKYLKYLKGTILIKLKSVLILLMKNLKRNKTL